MSERKITHDYKSITFEEFKKGLKPIPYTIRHVTHEEFCKEICPIIKQCIYNLLHPSKEEQKRRQQVIKEMGDFIFEWEVELKL